MGVFVSSDFKEELKKLIDYKNEEIKGSNLEPFDFEKIYLEYQEYAKQLKKHVIDTSIYLNKAIYDGKKILFEGAQGIMLCIENGTYPYVTSSSPTAAAVPLCTGIAPWHLNGAIGVAKAFVSREGAGPMPTLIHDEKIIKHFYKAGSEFEIRTQTYRRIGWFDAVLLNHGKRVSGLSYLAVTVLDALSGLDEIKICVAYDLGGEIIDYVPANIKEFSRVKPIYLTIPGWQEDISNVKSFGQLPSNAKKYIKKIEELVGVKVAIFSVGPAREQTILIKEIF